MSKTTCVAEVELIPFTTTLVVSLLVGLEYGILIGVASNVIFVLYASARPPVIIAKEKLPQGDVYVVSPSRGLQFPSAEYLREKVMRNCYYAGSTVAIDGRNLSNVDATVAKVSPTRQQKNSGFVQILSTASTKEFRLFGPW